MTFHSITATDDDKKREPIDLERIHHVIDWGIRDFEIQKTRKRTSGKYQRFVRIDPHNILANAVRIVLDNLEESERNLTYQLILIRVSVWRMKLMASLRTCERELQIVLGKTELLRATSKFARAPPIALVADIRFFMLLDLAPCISTWFIFSYTESPILIWLYPHHLLLV